MVIAADSQNHFDYRPDFFLDSSEFKCFSIMPVNTEENCLTPILSEIT